MDMYIKSLDVNHVDNFINPSSDSYARIDRRESEFNKTVDLLINIESVAIADDTIIIRYPNNTAAAIYCPSRFYHKIEVL